LRTSASGGDDARMDWNLGRDEGQTMMEEAEAVLKRGELF
jgi:hypothetical protein